MKDSSNQTEKNKPNHANIYASQAADYERLISKQSSLHLYRQLSSIIDFTGKDIIDLGAGTGRISSILSGVAHTIIALDKSVAMLEVAKTKLEQSRLKNWSIAQADHRDLPLPDLCADVIVSGWSISYLTNTGQDNWEDNLNLILAEAKRVLRPNGLIIIVETLGTGCTTPSPPDYLKPYYTMLEQQLGFLHTSFRVDYHFDNIEQALSLSNFFFGHSIAHAIQQNQSRILPECAGMWWRYLD